MIGVSSKVRTLVLCVIICVAVMGVLSSSTAGADSNSSTWTTWSGWSGSHTWGGWTGSHTWGGWSGSHTWSAWSGSHTWSGWTGSHTWVTAVTTSYTSYPTWYSTWYPSFSNYYPLTTSIASGSGAVTPYFPYGQPVGVGTMVYVTAYATSPGWSFSAWSAFGAYCFGGPYSNPCAFTMPSNSVTLMATFAQSQSSQTLTTSVASGQGSVNPDCPNGCSETVGSSVTVTASPSPGWQFASWSNAQGVSCSSDSCTFTMPNGPVTLDAAFSPQPPESTSFQFQGSLTGPISNGQIQLTSGSVIVGDNTYNLTGPASTACGTAVNVVCTSLGLLSAGQITLNNGYVMGLAACYTALNSSSLSLTFAGEPPNCGGSTAITQGFGGPVMVDITATGTLTVSGSQVTITGTGSGIVNFPETTVGSVNMGAIT